MIPRRLVCACACCFALCAAAPLLAEESGLPSFGDAPHHYWEKRPDDRFARLLERWKDQAPELDTSSEKTMLASLLRALEIDDSTQVMVFSATSLQSGIVNPRNPRAIYFNDDTYLGFIPGGRFEIASFDPELGMIFYISERSFRGVTPLFQRSNRCMNCHADTQSKQLPGLILNSVGVTWDGSTQETYRYDEIGHQTPLSVRFGGWHLTGGHRLATHHANLVGNLTSTGFAGQPNPPGAHCDLNRYPRPTSDIAPHLALEHQAGFLNRVVEAVYFQRARPDDAEGLDRLLHELARYVLFANEAKLPAEGVEGDPEFVRGFEARNPGKELRRLNLRERLVHSRCSYMIQSEAWKRVTPAVRRPLERKLKAALLPDAVSELSAHLPGKEKARIVELLPAEFGG